MNGQAEGNRQDRHHDPGPARPDKPQQGTNREAGDNQNQDERQDPRSWAFFSASSSASMSMGR
jgi:hypothetical protein